MHGKILEKNRLPQKAEKDGKKSSELKTGRKEYFVLAGILLLALVCWGGLSWKYANPGGQVVVSRDGEQIGSYSLKKDQELLFTDQKGRRNTLVIQDGQVSMKMADCPDGLCVEHKAISAIGESIICLPHRLVAEVTDAIHHP